MRKCYFLLLLSFLAFNESAFSAWKDTLNFSYLKPHPSQIQQVLFNEDGSRFFTIGVKDSIIKEWNSKTGESIKSYPFEMKLCFLSQDLKTFILYETENYTKYSYKVFDLETKNLIDTFSVIIDQGSVYHRSTIQPIFANYISNFKHFEFCEGIYANFLPSYYVSNSTNGSYKYILTNYNPDEVVSIQVGNINNIKYSKNQNYRVFSSYSDSYYSNSKERVSEISRSEKLNLMFNRINNVICEKNYLETFKNEKNSSNTTIIGSYPFIYTFSGDNKKLALVVKNSIVVHNTNDYNTFSENVINFSPNLITSSFDGTKALALRKGKGYNIIHLLDLNKKEILNTFNIDTNIIVSELFFENNDSLIIANTQNGILIKLDINQIDKRNSIIVDTSKIVIYENEEFFLNFVSIPNIKAVLWDFGDGETSSELNPFYSYKNSGIYDIKLKVITDNWQDSIIIKNKVEVIKRPLPKIRITQFTKEFPSKVIIENLSVGEIKSFKWDLGNGKNSIKMIDTIIYNNDGEYKIILSIVDKVGVSSYADTTITVIKSKIPDLKVLSENVIPYNIPQFYPNNFAIDNKDFIYLFQEMNGFIIKILDKNLRDTISNTTLENMIMRSNNDSVYFAWINQNGNYGFRIWRYNFPENILKYTPYVDSSAGNIVGDFVVCKDNNLIFKSGHFHSSGYSTAIYKFSPQMKYINHIHTKGAQRLNLNFREHTGMTESNDGKYIFTRFDDDYGGHYIYSINSKEFSINNSILISKNKKILLRQLKPLEDNKFIALGSTKLDSMRKGYFAIYDKDLNMLSEKILDNYQFLDDAEYIGNNKFIILGYGYVSGYDFDFDIYNTNGEFEKNYKLNDRNASFQSVKSKDDYILFLGSSSSGTYPNTYGYYLFKIENTWNNIEHKDTIDSPEVDTIKYISDIKIVSSNPAINFIKFEITTEYESTLKIEICNYIGQNYLNEILYLSDGKNIFQADISLFPTSNYFVRFITPNKQYVIPIVKYKN